MVNLAYENRELSILDRVRQDNPRAFDALVQFFENPPDSGKGTVVIRHGKLHGFLEERATY